LHRKQEKDWGKDKIKDFHEFKFTTGPMKAIQLYGGQEFEIEIRKENAPEAQVIMEAIMKKPRLGTDFRV